MNLVASLDYCETEPPSLEVFKRKEWLVLSHGNWDGQRDIHWYMPVRLQRERKRISVVGNIGVGWFDPKEARGHVTWAHLGVQALLSEAKREDEAPS